MFRVRAHRLLPLLGGLAMLVAGSASASPSLPQLPAQVSGNCVGASTGTVAEEPWPQRTLRPGRVWPLSTGAGVLVAVLDSGVHADGQLAGVVDGAGNDCAGHGTFVASLIAARPAATTGFVGTAPGARVLSVPTTASTAAAGIMTALSRHAGVICLSIVVGQNDPALTGAISRAATQGVPIVTPAFGDTGNPVPVSILAGRPGVITVAGVDPDGKDAAAVPPGAVVDVYAPGKAVVGLGPRGGQLVGTGAGIATGFVAATVALIRQYRPDLTPADVKVRVTGTAYQQNTATAAGTVDPLAAVTATGSPAPVPAARQSVAVPAVPAAPASRGSALVILGLSAAVIAAAVAVGAVVRRGRRRGWRAATRRPPR